MSVIEKIVEIPVTYHLPLMDCGHAGKIASFRGTVGEVGEERDCLICQQKERRSGDETE